MTLSNSTKARSSKARGGVVGGVATRGFREVKVAVEGEAGEVNTQQISGMVLIKLFESKIKIMLKLQIGQILAISKSDQSGV